MCAVHELGFDTALKWPDTHLHVRSLVVVGAASCVMVSSPPQYVTAWHGSGPALALKVRPGGCDALHAVHDVPVASSVSYPAAHSHARFAVLDSALDSCTLASAHERAAAHALAPASRYCVVPSHATSHALSVVLSPATVGRPLAWQPSAANVVCATHVLNVLDAATVSIMVLAPHSVPHALFDVLSPSTRGLPLAARIDL